jgi:hypothetical protein
MVVYEDTSRRYWVHSRLPSRDDKYTQQNVILEVSSDRIFRRITPKTVKNFPELERDKITKKTTN